MQWLLYLLCPLMMLFCMIGLFKGGKKESKTENNLSTSQDLNLLKNQMANIVEQNNLLTEEVKYLQSTKSNESDVDQTKKSSNIS
jgi:regulator of replication initiation timing